MSNSTEPTPRQLSYLKSLAEQTGTSFAYPKTRAAASREIDRLRALKAGRRAPSTGREPSQLSLTYATAAQPGEVAGYGVQASWYREPQDTSPTEKQLALISELASELGITSEEPDTRLQASEEIERLTDLKRRRRERPAPKRGAPSSTRSCETHPAPTDAVSQTPRERREPDSAACSGAESDEPPAGAALARYRARADGSLRELVTLPGAANSTLLVDRLACSGLDARLVAHLAPEEPPENTRVLLRVYLADATRGRCRLLLPSDFRELPIADLPMLDDEEEEIRDSAGRYYELRALSKTVGSPELRWTCSPEPSAEAANCEVLTLRAVVERLEAYEPVRTRTARALELHGVGGALSTWVLAQELATFLDSPYLLNRALREAVQDAVRRGTSLSEIAARCGRTKRDSNGAVSGETSWLARRTGQIPDSSGRTSAWIHTDVLALIAREGLCRSPVEVEVV